MTDTFHGQQLKAARALADLTVAELAEAAGVTIRTVHRLEIGGKISVSATRREGHVSSAVWDRIVHALRVAGVEMTDATKAHGAGVRWKT